MSEETSPAYISKVRLKGFKSIIDTECTFKPGLNIIIGDNGSGKSNFLDFLEMIYETYLHPEYLPEKELYCKVDIFIGKGIIFNYEVEKKLDINSLSKGSKQSPYTTKEKFFENNNSYKYPFHPFSSISDLFKIQFGTPVSFEEFSNSINFSYLKTLLYHESGEPINFYSYINEKNKNHIIEYLLNRNISHYLRTKFNSKELNTSLIIKAIEDGFFNLNGNLKKFTNILKIRINENFISNINENKDEFSISFLKFEFSINNEWHSWEDLSDGTKRLFYIVSTISLQEEGVFLIEEPELGIHPNQLFKLMEFLEEQSKTKQIIISTHSPRVLNHLKSNELDRILICRNEGEVGTKMYHLEDSEIESLQEYMVEDGFISDYWVHIGFEKEEMEK